MTFLKKLGQFLAQAVALATGIGPLVAPYLGAGRTSEIPGTVVNDLTQIAQIVTGVEAVMQTPGSGAQKLASATPLVLQILRSSQAFAGKQIANEALAEQGASKVVSGLADFMNAISESEAKKA
jgi:hypothetical protein